MRISSTVKALIKFRADQLDLKLGSIALKLELSPSYFSQMLNGLYHMPDETFQELLELLDLEEHWLQLRKMRGGKKAETLKIANPGDL